MRTPVQAGSLLLHPVATLPYPTVAQGAKSIDIPGYRIQLFRERLTTKRHATIPKGIVGGFVCPVLQRNLKE